MPFRQPVPLSSASEAEAPAPSDVVLTVEPRLVVVELAGVAVAASSCALRLSRPGMADTVYLPESDVDPAHLQENARRCRAEGLGVADYLTVVAPQACGVATDAAWRVLDTCEALSRLRGRIGFDPEKLTIIVAESASLT